jgi:hypothetical protein
MTPRQPGKTRAKNPARNRGLFVFDFLEVGINHIVFGGLGAGT